MIVKVWSDNTCRTNGCGCCSVEYNLYDDKRQVLEEMLENIEVLNQLMEHYGLYSYSEIKEALNDNRQTNS